METVKKAMAIMAVSEESEAKIFLTFNWNLYIRTINEHVKNIYHEKELFEKSTIRKFRIVQQEGLRQVFREIEFYSLG